jgi:hypothetical protein
VRVTKKAQIARLYQFLKVMRDLKDLKRPKVRSQKSGLT